jgi:adenine-specific DNA-methyltransferase
MSQTEYMKRLAQIEERRLREQAELDSRLSNAEKNRLGQFATPPSLAGEILRLAAQYVTPGQLIRFLDPGVGTGVFFSALLDTLGPKRVQEAVGFEVDERIAALSNELWGDFGLRVRCEDFTRATEPATASEKFNLIVCNPPYVRHHHLDEETKRHLKQLVAKKVGLLVNGLAGLYCYFMLRADVWLADEGVALWLVPAEFLDVNYGSVVREYLSTRVTLYRIHRFDPEDVQFSDALVSSCVVVFEKRPFTPDHKVELSSEGSLLKPDRSALVPQAELKQVHKWGRLAAGRLPQRQAKVRSSDHWLTIGDLFEIKRGIATGANEFFILGVEKARDLGLSDEFLLPILPSPRYITSDCIEADEQGWPLVSPRLVLLNCDLPRHVVKQLYPALDEHLRSGEAAGLTRRYLLRKRNPWYRQEVRFPAPILCTYMGRRKASARIFRFLRNYSKATAPNVYLMLYPKPWLREIELQKPGALDRAFTVLQRLSDEECLDEGRTYGGGLNKLEPRELARLRLMLSKAELDALGKRETSRLQLFVSTDRTGG